MMIFQKIKNGGYILVIRHGHRDKWEDVEAFDTYAIITGEKPEDQGYASAVCLSPKGKEQIKLLNKVFKFLSIKVSKIISSPSCRARQTAILGFDKIDLIDVSVAAYMFNDKEYKELLQTKFKKLLDNVEIIPNNNVVISGHGGTLVPNVVDIDKIGDKDTNGVGHVGEGGFTILERKNKKIIARYTFYQLSDFVEAAMPLIP